MYVLVWYGTKKGQQYGPGCRDTNCENLLNSDIQSEVENLLTKGITVSESGNETEKVILVTDNEVEFSYGEHCTLQYVLV